MKNIYKLLSKAQFNEKYLKKKSLKVNLATKIHLEHSHL